MAISSIGKAQTLINQSKAQEWTSKADTSSIKSMPLQDAPRSYSDFEMPTQSFGELLTNSLSKVNSLQQEANESVQQLTTGKSENIHETLLAVEKAEIAFKTMNQIRQKVITAYQEIMKMQV